MAAARSLAKVGERHLGLSLCPIGDLGSAALQSYGADPEWKHPNSWDKLSLTPPFQWDLSLIPKLLPGSSSQFPNSPWNLLEAQDKTELYMHIDGNSLLTYNTGIHTYTQKCTWGITH